MSLRKEDSTNKPLKEVSGKAEYQIIEKALIEAKFNKSKAAISLNINRRTLYNKLKAFKKFGF